MTGSAFGSPALPVASLEPVLVSFGEPGLTPLRLAGRLFQVRADCPREFWCRCAGNYPGYAYSLGLHSGDICEFNAVSLNRSGDWETRLRSPAGKWFMDDVELFRLLPFVELLVEDDPQSIGV
jgi:hypothetical protein